MSDETNYYELCTADQKAIISTWIDSRHPDYRRLSHDDLVRNINEAAKTYIDNQWSFDPENLEQTMNNIEAACAVAKLDGRWVEPPPPAAPPMTLYSPNLKPLDGGRVGYHGASEEEFLRTAPLKEVENYLKGNAPQRKPNIFEEGVNR